MPLRASMVALLATLAGGCDCGGGDDDDDSDASACPSSRETGTVVVSVDGPGTVPISLLLRSTGGTDESLTEAGIVEMPAGTVTVELTRTRTSGTIVGTMYVATPSVNELCVMPGETSNIAITVTADPASNRLWVTDSNGAQILGLSAADLGASGAPTPAAVLSGSFTNPGGAAMGADGMLWVVDEGHVEGYANADLGAGGAVQPAIVLDGADVRGPGIPGPVDLAFDRNGSLWIANLAGSRIDRFDADALLATGEPSADATVSGPSVSAPQAIAFDREGNLWVAGDGDSLVRFNATRLSTDVTTEADLAIQGMTPEPVVGALGPAQAIAFGPDGGLWAAHFGGNVIARYSEADRLNPGEVTPAAQLRVPVDFLLYDLAVDEEDGVWLTGAAGQVARIAPSQSHDTGDITPRTILTPTGLAYASSLAFYPAPSGSPIPY